MSYGAQEVKILEKIVVSRLLEFIVLEGSGDHDLLQRKLKRLHELIVLDKLANAVLFDPPPAPAQEPQEEPSVNQREPEMSMSCIRKGPKLRYAGPSEASMWRAGAAT